MFTLSPWQLVTRWQWPTRSCRGICYGITLRLGGRRWQTNHQVVHFPRQFYICFSHFFNVLSDFCVWQNKMFVLLFHVLAQIRTVFLSKHTFYIFFKPNSEEETWVLILLSHYLSESFLSFFLQYKGIIILSSAGLDIMSTPRWKRVGQSDSYSANYLCGVWVAAGIWSSL